MRRTVADVMTTEVAYATRETSYKEMVRLLAERRISSLPVVDAERQVVGIVSEADLLTRWQEPADSFQRFLQEGKQRRLERARTHGAVAEELMSSPAITVAPQDSVAEAARRLRKHLVKRLPVVDDAGRLVGIVSRADVLTIFLRPDEELCREILDQVIPGELQLRPDRFQVTVADGVVVLRGRCERRSLIPAVVAAVAAVDGVVQVDDRLDYDLDDRSPPPGASAS